MRSQLLAGLMLFLPISAGGQAKISVAGVAVLAKIRSGNAGVRAEGQRQLAASPSLLKNLAMGRALADVISADMKRAREANLGQAPTLPESLAELDSELTDIIFHAFDFRDPYITRALVFGAYAPQSRFAFALAGQGAGILPDVLELARNPVDIWRAQAIGVFGFMLERRRKRTLSHPLSPRQMATVRHEILAAARDKNVLMRNTAVQALGLGGGAVDIPLLRRIAATDPTCAQAPRAMNICWQARRAVERIEVRNQARGRSWRR